MRFNVTFTQVWDEVMPANLEFLSVYKMQRAQEFPGVPVRQFSDWLTHREWMRNERAKHLRLVNNRRIQDEIQQREDEEKKGG